MKAKNSFAAFQLQGVFHLIIDLTYFKLPGTDFIIRPDFTLLTGEVAWVYNVASPSPPFYKEDNFSG